MLELSKINEHNLVLKIYLGGEESLSRHSCRKVYVIAQQPSGSQQPSSLWLAEITWVLQGLKGTKNRASDATATSLHTVGICPSLPQLPHLQMPLLDHFSMEWVGPEHLLLAPFLFLLWFPRPWNGRYSLRPTGQWELPSPMHFWFPT